MSIKNVEMPNLGESVTEASVTMWLVNPGDKVSRYDPLMEVVSDKVTTEVPSDMDGVVKELLVELDTDVPIGTPVMSIEVEGGASEEESKSEEPKEAPKEEPTTAAPGPAEKPTISAKAEAPKAKGAGAARYSPAVMRLAQEKNIDLTEVEGTGKDGRITRKDIMNYEPAKHVEKEMPVAVEPKEGPTKVSAEGKPVDEPTPSAPVSSKPKPSGEPIQAQHRDEVVPATGIRKAIAKKMVQSTTEIPHAWVMVEADVTNIVKLRNQTKETFKTQEGISLSYFPFFVKAVVQALKKNPKMNTSWDNGNIIYHKDINLSIAVTTEDNLFVPVIHNADRYSLAGLAKEINRLASDVRSGHLKSEDMQGGTFTVNNTGTLGSVQSMGIINHPQAAILQVESINKRLVPTEDGGFKTADMINLCLSIDHRILDGMQAGNFLKDVKENLKRFSTDSDLY